MNERRVKIVEKVFALLDRDGSGKITYADVGKCLRAIMVDKCYSFAHHPDYISGAKTKIQLLNEFLNNFEGVKGNSDATITKEEFIDYYTDLSMSIPNDDYFGQMLESAWMVCESEGEGQLGEQIEQLTAAIRDGWRKVAHPLDEKTLQKLFKDINKSKNGYINIDELWASFARLSLSVERKYLSALLKKIDKNQSGTIEFDEFSQFLLSTSPKK